MLKNIKESIGEKTPYEAMFYTACQIFTVIGIGVPAVATLFITTIKYNVFQLTQYSLLSSLQLVITAWCIKLSCQLLWHMFFSAKDFTQGKNYYENTNPGKFIKSWKKKANLIIFAPLFGLFVGISTGTVGLYTSFLFYILTFS